MKKAEYTALYVPPEPPTVARLMVSPSYYRYMDDRKEHRETLNADLDPSLRALIFYRFHSIYSSFYCTIETK